MLRNEDSKYLLPIAGEAKVVKLTGSILSKNEGVLEANKPITYLATKPPKLYPTIENLTWRRRSCRNYIVQRSVKKRMWEAGNIIIIGGEIDRRTTTNHFSAICFNFFNLCINFN